MPFFIGGSYLTSMLLKCFTEKATPDKVLDFVYNDIDIYYGTIGEGKLKIAPGNDNCGYTKIPGIKDKDGKYDIEINKIKCNNVNNTCLANDSDVNATMISMRVWFENGRLMMDLNPTDEFWDFALTRELKSWGTDNDGKTAIRLAYKSMQNDLRVDLSGLNPAKGNLAKSHVEKFTRMQSWPESPLIGFELKPVPKKTGKWSLARKSKSIPCVSCKKPANKNCGRKMCKGCCQRMIDETVCKVKSHKPRVPEEKKAN